ncbi:MAG: restriction endonuclease subunit S [Acidobacteria bacterium]|nr:restriction endonuclease subunit S [Acidobacteriota bacterium]
MSVSTQQLPAGWTRTRLDAVCEVVLGQSPPGRSYNVDGEGLPFFQGKAEFGDYYPTPVKWCSAPTKLAEPEDVLISVRAPVGPTNICPSRACIGRGLAAIRPRDGMPSRYVLYALRASVARLREMATGTTFEAVSGSELRSHIIAVAPLDEQNWIVAEIEKQFTRLETGVAALQHVQANLKRYRAAVLRAACEGRLVPTEAALARKEGRSYETGEQLLARLLVERRQKCACRSKYKEPVSADNAELFPLPEGWTRASLGQLSWASSYGTSAKCAYESDGPPVLRIPNISAGRIDFTDLKFANASELISKGEELAPGDLLIIRTNGSKSLIGRSAVVGEKPTRPTTYASYLIRFRLIEPPSLFAWVAAIWDCGFLRNWVERRAATSAGQHNVSMSVLSALPIPVPPSAEQERIVTEFERRLSIIEELEAVVAANLQRATCLRQSILERAFSGRLTSAEPFERSRGADVLD